MKRYLITPIVLFLAAAAACQSTKHVDTPPMMEPNKIQLGLHSATTPTPRPDAGWTARFNALSSNASGFDGELIFIGDSITQGWEGAGKDVWHDHFAKRGALNLGISGDRTQHVIWRLANGNLSNIKPSKTGKRVAVIMIGTNNTGQGANNPDNNSAEEIADGIVGVFQTYHELMPDSKILLLGVFPRGEKPNETREKIKTVNGFIEALGNRDNLRFLDISDKFLSKDGTIDKAIMPDFLHLSPAGYKVWADAIDPTINDMLR